MTSQPVPPTVAPGTVGERLDEDLAARVERVVVRGSPAPRAGGLPGRVVVSPACRLGSC